LEPALFRDGVQRAAFQSLVDADDLHQAIDRAAPPVQALLVRLTVEVPTSDPNDVVVQLVRDAARRELRVITSEARTSAAAAQEAVDVTNWVQALDDSDASAAAIERLVAWLVMRARLSGPGGGR
jgi:hypothetical protein